jgi:hypothetical protein
MMTTDQPVRRHPHRCTLRSCGRVAMRRTSVCAACAAEAQSLTQETMRRVLAWGRLEAPISVQLYYTVSIHPRRRGGR